MDLPYVPIIRLENTRGLYHDDGILEPAYDLYLSRLDELDNWRSMDYLTLTNLMITTINDYLSVFTGRNGICWIKFPRPNNPTDHDKFALHFNLVLKFYRESGWEIEVRDSEKPDMVDIRFIDPEIEADPPSVYRQSRRLKFPPGSPGSGIGC